MVFEFVCGEILTALPSARVVAISKQHPCRAHCTSAGGLAKNRKGQEIPRDSKRFQEIPRDPMQPHTFLCTAGGSGRARSGVHRA